MLTRRQFHRSALGLGVMGLGLGTPILAQAQGADYPNRPIKIVVPFAAGGGPDLLTRRMATKLAEMLGKGGTIVVENIVGAGGILAAQNVARARPDGYTLLLGASSHIVQKAMEPSLAFDPMKDFTPIARTVYTPSILVVDAKAPYGTIEDLVAAARKEPGKLNYASGGIGSAAHLVAAAVVLQAKIDVVHVPYKGSVDIVPSILSGATQFAVPIASTALPLIRAGHVRALAVSSARRMPSLPDVPTLAEAFKTEDLALDSWFCIWAPADLPPPLVDRLFQALAKTYEDPAVRSGSEAVGAFVALSASPAEFTAFMQAETAKLGAIVRAANLKVSE
jgi:tripartite-type tricarboxylate transporter receptor subunit TctC